MIIIFIFILFSKIFVVSWSVSRNRNITKNSRVFVHNFFFEGKNIFVWNSCVVIRSCECHTFGKRFYSTRPVLASAQRITITNSSN